MKFDVADFERTYRKTLDESDPFYLEFLRVVRSEASLRAYRVANDVYEIPPAAFFTQMNASLCRERGLINDREEKQLIGALFGYLFKFMIRGYSRAVPKRVIDPRLGPAGDPPRYSNAVDSGGNEVFLVSASYFAK